MTLERAFGSRPPFTVGIEEELLLVDPETRALAHVAEELLARVDAPPDAIGHEAFASEIELRSAPSTTVADAVAQLAELRSTLHAAGATAIGAGLHPTAAWGDARLVDFERYARVDATMRGLIRRTPECALHVHVGMPDAETAIRVCNALRGWLPLLIGLGANSPWWFGADSGLASARYSIVRAYPRRTVPRAFADYDDYAATVEAVTAAGDLPDYTYLWWDVRLHGRLGTIELREIDAQSSLANVAAIAALVQALARAAADAAVPDLPPTEAIAESCFRASRDGLDATILHRGTLRPLREVAGDALALARRYAGELDCADELEGVEAIVRAGNGADRQRAAHARGGIDGLLEHLIEETGIGATTSPRAPVGENVPNRGGTT